MKIISPRFSWYLATVALTLLLFVGLAMALTTNVFFVQGVIAPAAPTPISIPAIPPMQGNVVARVFELTLDQGDTIPFHYHTGPAYGIVKTGTLTEDDGCGNIVTHSAGQAFFEIPSHVHEVRNDGADRVELYGMVVHPQDEPGTVNVSAPVCNP